MRRSIAPVLEGARLEKVEIRDPRLVRPFDPSIVANALVGERVGEVGRRGKYLIVGFESGRSLLIHLRMTGSLRHARSGALADDPYTRAVLRLDNGSDVGYRDVRRFGTWELFEQDELAPYLAARLGPEPLGPFSAARLGKRLQGRRAPLKSALLDQRTVAGLGNIYVDEALWQSRLHPLRIAGSLDAAELGRLYRAVRSVLRKAIERQGSTLRDYALPDGALRHDAGGVPRLRTRGRAVRPLRTTAHAHRRRRAHDHVLPALPDSAAMTPEARFDELLETARADESILGLILYGSRAAGMFVRDDSDWDVWLIVRVGAFADYEERYDSEHGDPVEIGTDTVAGLRAHGEPGTSHWWNRYAFRHAKVLVDKLDGEIGEIVDSKRTLPEDAAPAIAAAALDGYVNSTYRSLKAHRLGQVIGAHLDAADAASHLLDALFALRGRVRPWSKYLRWELESEPLGGGAAWRADVFLDRLESLLREPSPTAQQQLFRDVEELARSEGHGPVLDSWGPSLSLLRGTKSGTKSGTTKGSS